MFTPSSAENIRKKLKKTKYKIVNQIINLYTKTIGLIIHDGEKHVYLPTAPSPINTQEPYQLSHGDTSWWNDYETTKTMLQNIHHIEKKYHANHAITYWHKLAAIIEHLKTFRSWC